MDPIEASRGRFIARETDAGPATAFIVEGDTMKVVRGKTHQEIPTDIGLGGIALCGLDGRVLGYGALDVDGIAEYASMLDGRSPTEVGPLSRLAALGLGMVLPLDAMPAEVRDAFLAERVDPALIDAARLTDEAIAEVSGQHDHDHTDDCDTCDVRDIQARIDGLVEAVGHAVIVTPESAGEVSYTVGLADAGWPELVLSGIPTRAIQILNAVVETLRASDRRPHAGMTVDKAMSVKLKLRAIDDEQLGGAARARARARGGAPPTFLQVMWPDADGYYPTQRGYDDINLPQKTL